jgi:hypothetical protein
MGLPPVVLAVENYISVTPYRDGTNFGGSFYVKNISHSVYCKNFPQCKDSDFAATITHLHIKINDTPNAIRTYRFTACRMEFVSEKRHRVMTGSVSGKDVRHPGRRWRTYRAKMAHIPDNDQADLFRTSLRQR